MKRVVQASVLAVAAVVVAATLLASTPDDAPTPIYAGWEGEAEWVHLSALDGPGVQYVEAHDRSGTWWVVKIPDEMANEASFRFDLPPLTRHPTEPAWLTLISAKSTYLGCRVDPINLEAPGLWLIDACHQGQFNILDSGAARPGTPNHGPLPVAEVVLQEGVDPAVQRG